MALVVETGTGASNAESYAAVSDADTYWSNRNDTLWAALTTAAKEAALRRATDFMVQQYRLRWRGRRVLTTQALDWPRVGVVLDEASNPYPGTYGLFQIAYTIVPNEVKNACIELAFRASQLATGSLLSEDLAPMVASERVGSIGVDYLPGAKRTTTYTAIENMLMPYFAGPTQSNNFRLARA